MGHYDAIVVGARCGGAPVAMLLARRGHRVLLVDRARFPSEIPHGHYIHRGGPRTLASWGLLPRLEATRCPPVTSVTMDLGDFALVGTDIGADGIAMGYGPRRSLLDKLLVDAAVEAGAEMREAFSVTDYIALDGRVLGITGRSHGSVVGVAEHATITIGADGRNSRLARFVRAAAEDVTPSLTCWYFTYWCAADVPGVELYRRGRAVIFAFPTSGDATGVFIGWPREELGRVRDDVERRFLETLDTAPALAERLRAGRRVERFLGASDVPNFRRQSGGDGWALVGDAGCHKDPYMALGICDAFRDADLLARAIDSALRGDRSMDEALAEYGRSRDAATLAAYRENVAMARLGPIPPQILELRQSLRADREATRRFFLERMGFPTDPSAGVTPKVQSDGFARIPR
jgi:flavin-dependent dehydrogenase